MDPRLPDPTGVPAGTLISDPYYPRGCHKCGGPRYRKLLYYDAGRFSTDPPNPSWDEAPHDCITYLGQAVKQLQEQLALLNPTEK
jgi:hypothetical protein